MPELRRPDPDALLALVKSEEHEDTRTRGRLKIFFGATAGVGKTYAMLQAAQERRRGGADVVVGLVETHARRRRFSTDSRSSHASVSSIVAWRSTKST